MIQSLNKFIQFNPAFKDALLAADYIAFAHNELLSFADAETSRFGALYQEAYGPFLEFLSSLLLDHAEAAQLLSELGTIEVMIENLGDREPSEKEGQIIKGELKVLKIAFNLVQEERSLFRSLVAYLASVLKKSAQRGKIKALFELTHFSLFYARKYPRIFSNQRFYDYFHQVVVFLGKAELWRLEEQTTLKETLSLLLKVIQADMLFSHTYYSEGYLDTLFRAILDIKMGSGWRTDLIDHLFSLSLADRPVHPTHDSSRTLCGAILRYPLLLKYAIIKLSLKEETTPKLRILSCLLQLIQSNTQAIEALRNVKLFESLLSLLAADIFS